MHDVHIMQVYLVYLLAYLCETYFCTAGLFEAGLYTASLCEVHLNKQRM